MQVRKLSKMEKNLLFEQNQGRKNLGMPYEIVSWLESDDNTAYDYEQTLLKIIEPYKINTGLLYDGNTETYIIKG